MNILIATEKPFAPAAVEGIRAIVESSGHTLRLLEKYPDKATLLSAVADVDALIIRSDLVDAAPRLRIVVRAGAGVDNVDLDAATERDIVVMNTPGQNANAVAEAVSALTTLGFPPAASQKCVAALLQENPNLPIEQVIKQALKLL